MIHVLFVCLGNICRSPAAEGIMNKLLEEKGLSDQITIDSAGTGDWHIGKKADRRMRHAASNRGIDLTSRARQIKPEDFERFDYIVAMDLDNREVISRMDIQKQYGDKIFLMTDFLKDKQFPRGVPDPYYGGSDGFNLVLDILTESLEVFLDKIVGEHGLA